jgi:hypothetical protein
MDFFHWFLFIQIRGILQVDRVGLGELGRICLCVHPIHIDGSGSMLLLIDEFILKRVNEVH